ncbi:hypothetical protein [Benzoatithermus flavus]|uniref:Uncharacterized protein n=1 Tax=Benzoatithermus flavus TaxID=3108223 RepID=A0ABU8XVD1_9PROT
MASVDAACPQACSVVVRATVPATDTLWSKQAVEDALEEIASLLEGEKDQELVICGVGEDGDIRLDLDEIEAHANLRDHRSWLRTGFPPPPKRQEVVLNLMIEGSRNEVQQAVAELLRELGQWVVIKLVTMNWSQAAAAVPSWTCEDSRRALDLG